VGPYVADFCRPELRLIVERRDAHLQSMGYTVLRLPNGMVLQAPDLFVQEVVGFVLLREAMG
jgi:very-short-patch-repair endonuclease